ncbi:tetratricopeptide repeat-containing hybrid sensor histidine kinase/response regulator [Algibacter luteus]|uniref:tetratricopeptide repeat-containing hybrid sensor histidine kinase/response regulator n=1 Tax=Algibacter luteus TaxID=1178825 RepID=UPI0025968E52|nr:response regulator [Algibacter luteus]WJJ96178.1 response regulator [Algibacter luteus]
MRINLFICFLFFSILSFGKEDREIIKQIDHINSSALQFYNDDEIVKSFKEFISAKELSDSIQDHYGSATANYNLGNIYFLMENYESAIQYYNSTINVLKPIDDSYLISSSYLNLAKIYREQNIDTKSIQYFEKALKSSVVSKYINELEKEQIQKVFVEARINLCEIYIEKKNFDEALLNLLKLEDYLKTNEISSNLKGYYKYIYGVYSAHNELYNSANIKFREAIVLLKEGDQEIDLELLSNVYMQLSISLAKAGKSTEAYITLLEHNSFKDKLLNEEKSRQDLIIKSKFLIEDYKNEAQIANAARIQQVEIANKFKRINTVIFITLFLLIGSIIIIYRSYSQKMKLSKTLKVKNSELELAKDEALKSSELKSKFISNVSHELRTPLYGVVGITSLLLENNSLNTKDKKHLKSLKYSGDYLLNLINDILQVGKMEANKVELKNVSVNLKDMLADIVNSFDYRLEETNNQIEISIDNYVPEYIKCDKVRLSQILINLIGNSVKFTANGIINLRVKLVSLDNKNVGLNFEIEDNGIGISKDKFEMIFDNFCQLEDSNLNYQGTGLGLSITKNLIELFESEIKLESELGVGTKINFEINFELDQNKTKVISDFDSKAEKIENPEANYNILVAEDNKINQVVTKNLLKKHGYLCTIVENGKEALKEVKNNKYDLILMDINMPVMNGNEATALIRQFNNSIPIVALTAADIEDVEQNCKGIGYSDIIIKPFDNYEFFQVINENIQNAQNNNGDVQLVLAS